jgi:hypothetical protein
MRPWLSGITGPCQGPVGVSITPGRTHIFNKSPLKGAFVLKIVCGQSNLLGAGYVGNRKPD